jgi:hypothetical protein
VYQSIGEDLAGQQPDVVDKIEQTPLLDALSQSPACGAYCLQFRLQGHAEMVGGLHCGQGSHGTTIASHAQIGLRKRRKVSRDRQLLHASARRSSLHAARLS